MFTTIFRQLSQWARRGLDRLKTPVPALSKLEAISETLKLKDQALDITANGVVITDLSGRIQWANQAVSKLTGYSLAEMQGHNHRDLLKSGHHDSAFYQELWNTILSGRVWQGELVNRRKDRSLYHERMTITPLRNKRDEITHFVAIKEDATQRIESHDALREVSHKLRALLDSMAEGAYGIDTQGNCSFVNRAALRILGFDDENELLGKRVHDLIHHTRPDGSAYPASECAMFLASSNQQTVHNAKDTFWRKDGTPVPIESWSQPLLIDDVLVGAVATFIDITDRIKSETLAQQMADRLRQDQERSRDFSLSASDWFWETNAAHQFCYFSDNLKKVYGISPERLLGQSRQVFLEADSLNPPETVAEHLAQVNSHQPFKNFEYRVRTDDGGVRWVSVSGVPHQDAAGQFAGYRGTGSIVTERKQQEEDLRQAMQMAQAANLAKSRFLATMSHEIRTPMNGILGMAQLLLMPSLSEQERCDYAHTILSSGQVLLSLLNDILDLSKIEAGKFQLDSTVFSPETLLHETRLLFAGAAQSKQLQLSVQWQGPSGQRYEADAHRVRQMLSNLVGNAIKFTLKGQVLLQACEVTQDNAPALLEFSVTDSGIGIAPDKMDVLFKPFSQTDSSTTREYGGSGLGLSIVRNLAQAMGGDVGVSSVAGQGSRFWFRVRADKVAPGDETRPNAPTVAPEAVPQPVASTDAGWILVVEDNAVNRLVIESLLSKLGFRVTLVNDGQQALDLITQTPVEELPALVLMDLHMPVMDGYNATEHIRHWENAQQLARLPIVALTADAFEEDRQRCLAVGMDDFLSKPIALDALQLALSKWLHGPAPV